jgi:hypothetical protein
MRDLSHASEAEVAAERVRVATEGWGARVLAQQSPGGSWGGAAWNRGWDSTMHALTLLWHFGLDPASGEAGRAMALARGITWDCGPDETRDNTYFQGETEACINGQVAAPGAYFGQDVHGLVTRLLGEQLDDGGWNCEAPHNSSRSSFNSTLCVLEALLEYERTLGPTAAVTAARLRGQEYLLARRLLRRLSTGEVINDAWTRFAFPNWWHYDVLRALDYLRHAGVTPDERVAEAVTLVESKRGTDGRWRAETVWPGRSLVELDEGEGQPSRWITLRALRVLDWYRGSRP